MSTFIRIKKGDSLILRYIVEDATTKEIINISGFSVAFSARKKYSTDVVMSIAGTIDSGVDGTCSVAITSTKSDITPGKYIFDVVIAKTTEVYTIDSGIIEIQDTTKES